MSQPLVDQQKPPVPGWGEEEARLMDLDADQKVTFQDQLKTQSYPDWDMNGIEKLGYLLI